MSGQRIYALAGLPGRAGKIKGLLVADLDAMLREVSPRRAAVAAGDHGSINVYFGDDAKLRAVFCSHRECLDEATFASEAECLIWLRRWWPVMRGSVGRA